MQQKKEKLTLEDFQKHFTGKWLTIKWVRRNRSEDHKFETYGYIGYVIEHLPGHEGEQDVYELQGSRGREEGEIVMLCRTIMEELYYKGETEYRDAIFKIEEKQRTKKHDTD